MSHVASVAAPALARFRNAEAVALARVPELSVTDLRAAVLAGRDRGQRLLAFSALPAGDGWSLFAVLADDGEGVMYAARAPVAPGDRYPALTPEWPQAHLLERELWEAWNVTPEGHPWRKPVRFSPARVPGRPAPEIGVMEFYRVEGEEVHEVAVGPVHAGIIEPGHFRFQCHGEEVFHLEISLGYQHRGVERALVGGPDRRSIHYAETLAGDTTVGHATAYAQLLEALAGVQVSARDQILRGIALELERLACHTGDLGALAGDVGFLPTSSFCGRLRGDFLNLTAELCGNRFGRGVVRPGGVGFRVDAALLGTLRDRLRKTMRDVRGAVDLLWESPTVMSRFEGTGVLSREAALELGLVGPAARASGVHRDVRRDFPVSVYRFSQLPVSGLESGDVFARAYVRWLEIERSAEFLEAMLAGLPEEKPAEPVGSLAPEQLCVSLVEAWRGEVCHLTVTGADGRFAGYKVIDPSFRNWSGLARALRGQGISDFPLCNKSFNLSYCGFDL